MRAYALAIAAAALFALPTSAFSQGIEFGPEGVRVDPGYHGYYHGRSGRSAYGGRCRELRQACLHKELGEQRQGNCERLSPNVRAGLTSPLPRQTAFFAAEMEPFERASDLLGCGQPSWPS